ncbi:MAG: hypothetical protein WDM85_17260 [Caulobacteraceae bacterium]
MIIRGGRYSSGAPPRGYYDANGDAPPPGGDGVRATPERAMPERGWRDEPPQAEQDQEAPPPRRQPPPNSSADDDPR